MGVSHLGGLPSFQTFKAMSSTSLGPFAVPASRKSLNQIDHLYTTWENTHQRLGASARIALLHALHDACQAWLQSAATPGLRVNPAHKTAVDSLIQSIRALVARESYGNHKAGSGVQWQRTGTAKAHNPSPTAGGPTTTLSPGFAHEFTRPKGQARPAASNVKGYLDNMAPVIGGRQAPGPRDVSLATLTPAQYMAAEERTEVYERGLTPQFRRQRSCI